MRVTDFLRRVVLGKKGKFVFEAYDEGIVDFKEINNQIGLYIHIPFCKSLCPYCPYNKILYDPDIARQYQKALIKEVLLYKDRLKGKQISSLYIGGGSPALMLEELQEIISLLRIEYQFSGEIGIELYPGDVDRELLTRLKEVGIELISLGVQTFNDEKLDFLGRCYTGAQAEETLSLITSFDFKCVDVDLMTNLPGQTLAQIEQDLRKVYAYPIDQLSIYPLIVFPLTDLANVIREKGLKRFGELGEGRILRLQDRISQQYGYEKTSVWTYGKNEKNRYTSVTRESFLGLGAGASSHFGSYFYLNTFNVEQYIQVLNSGRLPINLVNTMTERERMAFWLFWRCYDGVIDEGRFRELFGREMKEQFRLLFAGLKLTGMIRRSDSKIFLSGWGRFAYHWVEKQYSLYYLNNLWQQSMEQPWIKELLL
jgi:coproporphyrinogen III oxidase-like Fe-S oxidoreductase